jgi:hypothetical protein
LNTVNMFSIVKVVAAAARCAVKANKEAQVALTAKQLSPIKLVGNPLQDSADHGGGYGGGGDSIPKVSVGGGEGGPGQNSGIKPINGPLQRKLGNAGGIVK